MMNQAPQMNQASQMTNQSLTGSTPAIEEANESPASRVGERDDQEETKHGEVSA